jgi:hypothetical protein
LAPTADSTSLSDAPTTDLPTPTSGPDAYWIQPGVPELLRSKVAAALSPAGWIQAEQPDDASLQLVLMQPGLEVATAAVAQWYYALVAPFPTVPDDMHWLSFLTYWQGNGIDPVPFGGTAELF